MDGEQPTSVELVPHSAPTSVSETTTWEHEKANLQWERENTAALEASMAKKCPCCARCFAPGLVEDNLRQSLHDVALKDDIEAVPLAAFYSAHQIPDMGFCCHGETLVLYRDSATSDTYSLDMYDRLLEIKESRKTAAFFSTRDPNMKLASYTRAIKMSPKRGFSLKFRRPLAHVDLRNIPASQVHETISYTIQNTLHRQPYRMTCCDSNNRCCYNFGHDLMVQVGAIPGVSAGGFFAVDGKFEAVNGPKLCICSCLVSNCLNCCSTSLHSYLLQNGYEDAVKSLDAQELEERGATFAGCCYLG